VSAQKAFQESETETMELLKGTEENNTLTDEGLLIHPSGKSFIFYLPGLLTIFCLPDRLI